MHQQASCGFSLTFFSSSSSSSTHHRRSQYDRKDGDAIHTRPFGRVPATARPIDLHGLSPAQSLVPQSMSCLAVAGLPWFQMVKCLSADLDLTIPICSLPLFLGSLFFSCPRPSPSQPQPQARPGQVRSPRDKPKKPSRPGHCHYRPMHYLTCHLTNSTFFRLC